MSEYLVEMEHIVKTFPGVKALNDVQFHLKSGEVMALLGENGAGKSTLMKILSGVYTRDSGKLVIDGKEYGDLNPKLGREAGVAIIHQELNMCRHLSVAENMFLGREIKGKVALKTADMEAEAKKYLDELGVDIDPKQCVGDLPVSKQQMVEIAKALSVQARVLIMDEPTSALTSREIEELFKIIRQLRAKGCGIVYISHRLEELAHITDRVTIMRDGQFITEGEFQDFTMDRLIANMVGREIKEQFPRVPCEKGEKIFEVRNLNAGKMVRDISFSLYSGEIVGFSGLMGAGRTETTRAIFGVDPKNSGQFILDGKEVKIDCPRDAIRAGIVLAPEDRKKDGLCTKLSIRQNFSLPNMDMVCGRTGIVNAKKEEELCSSAVKNLLIKTANLEVNAETLSGGNQQKIVVGKWLARNSRVVIFDEPTRGIDVGAKVEIYNLMNQLKQQGIAVMFVSSEMPEVLGIADRVIVMCDGRITADLPARGLTQNEVLKYATQFEKKIESGVGRGGEQSNETKE
ncbi:MAG: sugar ABC transporter ATP-binding protein [Lachnospiraceae bacterium]